MLLATLPAAFLGALGCAAPEPALLAPAAPWFYADLGEGIDWDSLTWTGSDLRFRSLGGDLGSGPLRDAAAITTDLACDLPTRLWVALDEGEAVSAWSSPSTPCAEQAALTRAWGDVGFGALTAGETAHAIVILDVPGVQIARVSP